MRRVVIAAAVAALFVSPVSAAKKPQPVVVETASVGDKPTVTIDPRKAYIVVRSAIGPTPFYLMKVPTAEEQAAYDHLRHEEFVKAHAKFVKKQADYERTLADAAKRPLGTRPPEKPVEPIEETFEIKPIGIMGQVQFGPQFRFAKGDGRSIYLQEVTPGWYRIYGSMLANDQAAAGICFCMGSIKFEAKAGEVVDLGTIKPQEHPLVPPPGDSSFPQYDPTARLFDPTPRGGVVDPRLQSFKVVPAAFKPVGKLPNYYGVMVTRVPAIPGIMSYDRDQIIDLTAGR